jgi:CRP-like cAMP-binding protein
VALEDDIEVLRRIPFFEGFSEEHLRMIASSAETRSLPEKLLVYDEGQLLHSAYVIVSGTLRAEKKGKPVGEAKPREIGPGSMLGERALILDIRAADSVRVVSRARVLQIRKAAFRRLLQEYPQIAITLRARLMQNVLQVSAEFNDIAQRLRNMNETF